MNNENIHTDFYELSAKYLSGEASPNEISSLEKLVKLSEENKKRFIQFKRVWQLSITQKQKFDLAKARKNIEAAIGEKTLEAPIIPLQQQSSNYGMIYKIAAGIAVFLTVGFLSYYYFTQNKTSELLASNQIVVETLLDGTEVSLNKQSSLSWSKSFNKEEREVKLQGDAFFDVAKNPDKPFIIQTGEVRIRVLGTAFYVDARNTNDKIEVNVSRGKVSVESPGQQQVVLGAGELAIFDKREKLLAKYKNKDKNVLAWKTKILVFENTALEEVVYDINHAYSANIRLANPLTAQCRLTATYNKLALEDVLSVVSETLSLEWNKTGDGYVLSGENCED